MRTSRWYRSSVFLPLLLLTIAGLSAALLSYGTHPGWFAYRHGLELILFSRQYQWPLAALAILMCLGLIGLVVGGKRRAWWLIGLGPVLALFVHRFHTDPLREFAVLDDPAFVTADEGTFLADSDWVVGVIFNGNAYAYPYYALYRSPVVFKREHDKRMMLMWSAFANRAVAVNLSHDLRARDVEIVSTPGNALLLYDRRLGQFINGLTGLTPAGAKVIGFGSRIAIHKTTWGQWSREHPNTRVMIPVGGPAQPKIPNGPIEPYFTVPRQPESHNQDRRIVLLGLDDAVAFPQGLITLRPLNLTVGAVPALVYRDPQTGRIRAFDRRIEDLVPRFRVNTNPAMKGVYLVDSDTNSGWSADGRAVTGPMAKQRRRLAVLPVDEDLPWSVLHAWMPTLTLGDPATIR